MTVKCEARHSARPTPAERSLNAPSTRISGGPSPTRSNTMLVPSLDITFGMHIQTQAAEKLIGRLPTPLQGRRKLEGAAERGTERGDLRDPVTLNAQHVDPSPAEARLTGLPHIRGGCQLAIRRGGQHAEFAPLPVDRKEPVQQLDRGAAVEPQWSRRHRPTRVLAEK